MPPSQASIVPPAPVPLEEALEEDGALLLLPPSVSRRGEGVPAAILLLLFLLVLLPETSSAARCRAATRSACAPSLAALRGPCARFPRAVKSEMMTFVW